MKLCPKKSRRGQSLVEYIMICAVVVGGLMAFRDSLLDPLITILTGATKAIQVEATRGGERSVQNYYAGSCATTDKRASCQ